MQNVPGRVRACSHRLAICLDRPSGVVAIWVSFPVVGFQPPRHLVLHNGKRISPGSSRQHVSYHVRAGRGVKPWGLSVWAVRRGSSVVFGRPWCFRSVFSPAVTRCSKTATRYRPAFRGSPSRILRAGRAVKPWSLSVWAVRRGSSVVFAGRVEFWSVFRPAATWCSNTATRYRPLLGLRA
jgi:hypothetical protein